MVGGTIINVVRLEDGKVWVQVQDRTYSDSDACAVRLKSAPDDLKIGDSLWWQSSWAFWTPKPSDGRSDVRLDRAGYSHSHIPDDVLAAAFGLEEEQGR